jgi:hypothetical protein
MKSILFFSLVIVYISTFESDHAPGINYDNFATAPALKNPGDSTDWKEILDNADLVAFGKLGNPNSDVYHFKLTEKYKGSNDGIDFHLWIKLTATEFTDVMDYEKSYLIIAKKNKDSFELTHSALLPGEILPALKLAMNQLPCSRPKDETISACHRPAAETVCDCNGASYGSICEADKAGVIRFKIGKCKSDPRR